MIARRLGLDHRRGAGRVEAGEEHGGLDLRRGNRRPIGDRHRVDGAAQRERQAACLGARDDLGAHRQERRQDAHHRPLAQRGIAVEGRSDAVAGDDAHHQARAGAGIAEIERGGRARAGRRRRPRRRARRPRRARLTVAPSRRQASAVASTSAPSSRPSICRLADRQQAEDQRAMRDRLVARHAHAPLEAGATAGRHRRSRLLPACWRGRCLARRPRWALRRDKAIRRLRRRIRPNAGRLAWMRLATKRPADRRAMVSLFLTGAALICSGLALRIPDEGI